MTKSTDIASTIGTWIAAGLALLALIGIVGPFLVWRASKSERSQAINALDDGTSESFGFVDRGIWAGPNSRAFRRVRAPNLKAEPSLNRMNLLFDHSGRLPSETSASWVQFCSLLQAYRLPMRQGDHLIIESTHAWLPLRKSWILIVGLAGRFGRWQDKGKLATKIASGTASTQARPGRQLTKSRASSYSLPPGHRLERKSGGNTPGWKTSRKLRAPRRPWDDTNDRMSHGTKWYSPIYGLTGILHVQMREGRSSTSSGDAREYVFFTRHRASQAGELGLDRVGMDQLFWLAVGCLPASGKKVFCLDDVEDVAVDPTPLPPGTPDFVAPPISPAINRPFSRNSHVHFDNDEFINSGFSDNSSSSSGDIGSASQRPPVTPVTYVVASPSHPGGGPSARSRMEPWMPRAFRLSIFNERSENLSSLADIVKAEGGETAVYSLEEMDLDDDARTQLKLDNSATYLRHTSPWVRLGRGSSSTTYSESSSWVMHRPDAQLLAQALLRLPLSPHGYLIAARPSACKLMLSAASDSLPQLVTRTIWGSQFLELQPEILNDLLLTMNAMYDAIEPLQLTRKYFGAIFELDRALSEAIPLEKTILGEIIGILMITSAEFRSLVTQSARHIAESGAGSVELDLEAKALNMGSVMNFMYRFPVDLDMLYKGQNIGSGKVSISHAEVMLICQKAALRSAMLETSLDSSPLFSAVGKMKDVVHMG